MLPLEQVPVLPAGLRSLVVLGIKLTCISANTSYPVGQSNLLPLGEKLFSYKRATPEKAALEMSCPGVCVQGKGLQFKLTNPSTFPQL